jgi:cyclic pyranopterin phosphate synthase
MPLDADGVWSTEQVLSGEEVREIIDRDVAELEPIASDDPSQPATEFHYRDRVGGVRGGRVGFINSVTQPFCGRCNRLRLTAEGQVRNCLFSTTEWDARALLRASGAQKATNEQIVGLVQAAIGAKKFGHGIDTPDFVKPQRAMYQIGG